MNRRQHALNHLSTPSALSTLSCMVHSTERVRHRAHLYLDPTYHHLRSTCPSWSPGHRHRSPVHLVLQSVTPQDLFLRLWRRCRHRLPQCSIHTIWCPSSIRVAQPALTATRGQRYIPKGWGVICSVTRRIPITSSRHTRLQKGLPHSTVTSFPYRR